jgi:hypothetical protein
MSSKRGERQERIISWSYRPQARRSNLGRTARPRITRRVVEALQGDAEPSCKTARLFLDCFAALL